MEKEIIEETERSSETRQLPGAKVILKNGIRKAVVFIVLLFPWWLASLLPFIVLVFIFTWSSSMVADYTSHLRDRSRWARFFYRSSKYMRFGISVPAVTISIVLLTVLQGGSPVFFWISVFLVLLSITKRFRWVFPVAYMTIIISMTISVSLPGETFSKQLRQQRLPQWLEPVLVKGLIGPECQSEYSLGEGHYQVRSIAFEPDESALYTAVLTDTSRDKTNIPALTVFKVGLEPGVEGACWFDELSVFVSLDSEARRLYVSQRNVDFNIQYIKILDADSFELLDTWTVRREYEYGGFSLQETLLIKDKGILLALSEGESINGFDVTNGHVLYSFGMGLHSDFAYDPESHVLFTANYLGPLVTAISLEQKKVVHASKRGLASWGIFYRPGAAHLYVTDFFIGKVYRLDKNNLKTLWKKHLAVGIRSVLADEHRGVLYVGNYVFGDLYIISMSDPSQVSTVHVGPGIYQIVQSPKTKQIYLGTKAGIFRLNLDKLDPNPFNLKN